MKIIGAVLLALFLSACGSPGSVYIVKEVPIVIIPEAEMYSFCKGIDQLPDPSTLTDLEVANTIVMIDTKLRLCVNTVQEIRDFLEKAKRKAEAK